MKTFLLKLLNLFIQFLQSIIKQATTEGIKTSQPYHSLSPIGTVEEKQYINALKWALHHRKEQDIKNIALTGPYGSGKSSILKTFQFQYKQQFQFLNISLATFKEELKELKQLEKGKGGKVVRDESKDLLRLIELSILQQIFYHEKDSKIPDSRFKKIRSFKKYHLLLIAASILLLLLCGFCVSAPGRFYQFFALNLKQATMQWVKYIALVVFISGLFFVIYRSIRLLNNIKISKLKFQDAEIEIDKEISKSILNNHLDEILYFFEVTAYDVVVIEDLDRFEQTEIFTKLRELNLLINNSKKIKKEVAFIYAVRDDMFQDKDRTKFFDFIIPVIPVINSSNSNNKLLKIANDNTYDISPDLIDDVGLFVDDMRLLYNITNEYHLYRELLDSRLTQDKLFSMIVYKNIFPNDFVKLSKRDGDLYQVFANKQAHVTTLQKQLDQEIKEIKAEVKRLTEIRITDIRDLRMLYLVRYPAKLPQFLNFYHSGKDYSLTEAAENEPFQMLLDKTMSYRFFAGPHYNSTYSLSSSNITFEFSVIEKEVDPARSYIQRATDIEQDGENSLNALRRQIQDRENKKAGARHLKIKDLLAAGAVNIDIEDKQKSLLFNVLLRTGHIDEDYLDYISIFYEGSITKDDREFLLNVKSQLASDLDFQLHHLDKLVPKIGLADFGRPYILNYSLLDFLLSDTQYDAQLGALLNQLKQPFNTSIEFIDGFIAVAENLDAFIFRLAKSWPEMWQVINAQAVYTDDKKFKYLDLIISSADIKDIESMDKCSNLRKALLGRPNLLSEISNAEKLKLVISKLNLTFSNIDLTDAPSQLVDFIYSGNHYQITSNMLRNVIQAKGTYKEDSFNKANYNNILQSGAEELISYVENNISEYVAMVYLDLPENILEPEESLLSLLNHVSLSVEDRQAILEKTTSTISLLSGSKYVEVDSTLLSALRVKPLWANVMNYFTNNANKLTDQLMIFLNHLPNAEALAHEMITDADSLSEDEAALVDALIKESRITGEAFEYLVKAIPTIGDAPDFTEIDEDHAEILIENDLVELFPANFDALKDNFDRQHISLAERNVGQFIEAIDEYAVDNSDLILFLKSTKLTTSQKQLILDSAKEEVVVDDIKLLATAGRLVLQDASFKLSKAILIAILTKALNTMETVKLFNMNFRNFDKAEVTYFLQNLPEPYSEIAIKGRRPVLEYEQENDFLVNNLIALKYISKRDDERKGIRISTFKK